MTHIMVLNLPKIMTDAQLRKTFSTFGKVNDASMVMDENTGISKGFGFVTMSKEEEAIKAVEKLHGSLVKNHKIRVKRVNDNQEKESR